jgi:hypothetical protein
MNPTAYRDFSSKRIKRLILPGWVLCPRLPVSGLADFSAPLALLRAANSGRNEGKTTPSFRPEHGV